jgi:hypothetical protein
MEVVDEDRLPADVRELDGGLLILAGAGDRNDAAGAEQHVGDGRADRERAARRGAAGGVFDGVDRLVGLDALVELVVAATAAAAVR